MPAGDDPAAPLGDEALRACLDPWIGAGGEAVGAVLAVSGGPDSTALMGAAALLARRRPVLVVTVDHGLRPGAGAEAEAVGAAARALGLPHRRVAWTGEKPRTGLQAAARAARYALLVEAARTAGASHVLTAHTLDDQAETVLMRLMRGSDVGGLAGMRPASPRGGLVLARPFLALPKARLVATCRARGWSFVADPANADPRFLRARLRALMPALAAEGLTARRLAIFAARAARADAAVEARAREVVNNLGPRADDGSRVLDGRLLGALPEAVAIRVVAALVGEAAPALREGAVPARGGEAAPGPVRLARLERLVLRELRPALTAGAALRRTLAGTLVSVAADGALRVGPAPPRRGS